MIFTVVAVLKFFIHFYFLERLVISGFRIINSHRFALIIINTGFTVVWPKRFKAASCAV